MVALLDGREEGVEVHVEDRPVRHARYHRPAVEASAGGVPGRRIAALALALIGGAVVTLVVPVASIVLVWPFLFAVPGWVVVRRVAPDLPVPGQVGVAVVVSVYLSAHLVDVVARIGGFDRPSILVATVLIAIGTVTFAALRHPWLAPVGRPTLAGIRSTIRTDGAAWLVAATFGLIVAAVLFANGWRETPDGWVSGGWNWSDLLVHVAIGASIVNGNFPPEVPYFAGTPLTYHWFADLHGAITSSVAGLDLIWVYFATSAVFASVMALLVWTLALRLTGDRRVAAIAAVLACLGGGMGWMRLVGDVLAGSPDVAALLTQNPYDNSWEDGWPFFRIASVLGTAFLPHRASTLGLPGLIAAVLLVVQCLGRRPAGVLLAGIIAALLAPFQFYAFPATYLIVGLYVVTTGAWRAPTARRDAALFLGPLILAVPFIAEAIFQQSQAGAFRFIPGWSEARFGEGALAVVFFYATNLGVPFALALVAAVTARGLPTRWFLVAWLVALFVVPNVVVLSAVDFDMNKYFQMMWIAVAILAAWLIRRWPRPAIATVLVVCSISPALIAVWHVTSTPVTMSLAQERAARWIETNTPDRSVFLADAFINSPVDLAGRMRITTFGPYVSNLGYDPGPREADVNAAYCDGPEAAAAVMERYGATYVLSSGGVLDCDDLDPTDFDSSERFVPVFEDDGVRVWRLDPP
jgi:hypothetical protein